MATRKSPPKKKRTSPRKPPPRRSSGLPELRVPKLDAHQLDILGLGLVGLAAFFAPVFYLDWDGGKVGEALASAFRFMLGGVAYLVPIAFFATGALIVLRTLLPSIRPFRSGAICLVTALMLGLAGTLFGLGPGHRPPTGFFEPAYFRGHGGAIGEGLYYVTSTLFSRFGSYLIFVFLLVAGVMLLTGASIAGVIAATREGVSETRRRVRQSTGEFAAVVTGRPAADDHAWAEPLDQGDPTAVPADVEPVVRATHVEAPVPRAFDDEPEPEPEPGYEESDSELTEEVFEPPPPPEPGEEGEPAQEELTPMGKRRTGVTESDEVDYRLPSTTYLRRSSGATKVNAR